MKHVVVGEIPAHLKGKTAVLLRRLGLSYAKIERALRLRPRHGCNARDMILARPERASTRSLLIEWTIIDGMDVGRFTAGITAPLGLRVQATFFERMVHRLPIDEKHIALREMWRVGLGETDFMILHTGQGILDDRHKDSCRTGMTQREAARRVLGVEPSSSKSDIKFLAEHIDWGESRKRHSENPPTILHVGIPRKKGARGIMMPAIYLLNKNDNEMDSLIAVKTALLARKKLKYDWQDLEITECVPGRDLS